MVGQIRNRPNAIRNGATYNQPRTLSRRRRRLRPADRCSVAPGGRGGASEPLGAATLSAVVIDRLLRRATGGTCWPRAGQATRRSHRARCLEQVVAPADEGVPALQRIDAACPHVLHLVSEVGVEVAAGAGEPRLWVVDQVIDRLGVVGLGLQLGVGDRKSTRLNSSHVANSYAVFCLKKKKRRI